MLVQEVRGWLDVPFKVLETDCLLSSCPFVIIAQRANMLAFSWHVEIN